MKFVVTLLSILILTFGITTSSTLAGNRVLSLDGDGDYVSCGTPGIPTSPPVTLEAWVYFVQDQLPEDYDYIIQVGTFNGDIFNISRQAVTNRFYYIQGIRGLESNL